MGGVRTSVVLALVALVPMFGTFTLAWQTVSAADVARSDAARTDELARDAIALVDLNSALLDEMVWAAIVQVASDLGASDAMLADFLSGDPAQGLADARARADDLLARVDRSDVARATEAARATTTEMGAVLLAYRDAMDVAAAPLDAALDNLSVTTTGAKAEDLPDAARALRSALDARAAVADEFYGFFATLFDLRDAPGVELQRLIQARGRWQTSVAELTEAAQEQPELAGGVAQIVDDQGLEALDQAIDSLIGSSLEGNLPEQGAAVSLESILPQLPNFVAVYEAATAVSDTTSEVVDAATQNLLDATGAVRVDADRRIQRSYALSAALGLLATGMALAAARFIVRPLRALRRTALALEMSEAVPVVTGGPAEVRAAAQAIQSAAGHLDRVTRQVRALAVGSLDAPVLELPAPGGLGAAVQSAVGTLRTALSQQDEFRRRLAHEASHDGLTQLPNRNASMAQLTRSLARTNRSGAQLAVFFVDLDGFKDVNDHNGHHAGDVVLPAVAQRLVNGVREGDHVGRLGGDEFIVIAEPVNGVDEAVGLAQRLIDQLADPIDIGTDPVRVGASIGVAVSDGRDLTADELLRDADLAVYRAKAQGRGGIVICDEDLRLEMAETADLTQAIRHAIEHDEFVLHYQAIVDTQSGRLRAFEALVRWQRPGVDGLVPPDQFIGFAERSALIIEIDRWVVGAAARQLHEWHAAGRFVGVPVAVNVSPRHLAHADFVAHVLAPLEERGLDAGGLIVEVTENALLDDLAGAAAKLQRLRDAGVRVSIDDFGTGYTSLAHLRSLPVDILKIDRSLTVSAAADPHEASIVKLIIDTGHLLGATVTAEGVETADEVAALVGLGSDSLQGFYFARPQRADWLDEAALGRATDVTTSSA